MPKKTPAVKKTASPEQVRDIILYHVGACQHDPLRWIKFAWDWRRGPLSDVDGPRVWQRQVAEKIGAHLQDPKKRYTPLQIAVASGHSIGKSSLMGMLTHWAMSCFDESRIMMTANTENQLRTKTAPEVGKWFRTSINSAWFDVQSTSIKALDPKRQETWRADFVPWSEHNTEAFAGLHNKGRLILLCFDEASAIADRVWEVVEGALTDENTIIIWLVFGNPTRNAGRFRECFRKYRHRWDHMQIDARTVEGVNKDKIQQWVDDYGEDSDFVKVRVRGQFPEQSAMQFISAADVDKARNAWKSVKAEQLAHAPVILGVDPAWTGDDKFEIVARQGRAARTVFSCPRNDDDVAMANKIANLQDELGADAVFIDAGFGTGIYSIGKALGRTDWFLVWFGGKSPEVGYLNMRAYIWGMTKQWLKDGGAIDPADDELYQDLIGPETVSRMDGKIQLESKADMKARGLPSPNKADALCLRGGTLIETPRGTIPIEQIQVGDTVYTPLGIATVKTIWTSLTKSLTTAKFSDGSNVVGKGSHKVFSWNGGEVHLDALQLDNDVESFAQRDRILWKTLGVLSSWAPFIGLRNLVAIMPPGTRLTASGFYIAASGQIITALFQKVTTFITETATRTTTILPIWNAYPAVTTIGNTAPNDPSALKPTMRNSAISNALKKPLGNGIHPPKDDLGILTTRKSNGKIHNSRNWPVSGATDHSNLRWPIQGSAPARADRKPGFTAFSRIFAIVLGAAKNLGQTVTARQRVVPVSVATENVVPTAVYNLTLDRDNAYYANGILVFNCLTFAAPVQKKPKSALPTRQKHQVDYNPMQQMEHSPSASARHQSNYDPLNK